MGSGQKRLHLFILFCLIAAGLLAMSHARELYRAWEHNQGYLRLNKAYPTSITQPLSLLPEAPSTSELRLEGHLRLLAGDFDGARQALEAAGWSATDFGAMAEHYVDNDIERALTWFALAAATTNPPDAVITRLGEVCQTNRQSSTVCDWFVEQNLGNRFVNPRLADDLSSWRHVETAATYASVPCRGSRTHRCAEISVTEPEIQPSAGLGQCLQVSPGATYRFSSWLKVSADIDTVWRPLYRQGLVAGEAHGQWPGDERGASEWRYWESEFIVPDFDEGQACFYPIRLTGEGQAWVYAPQLTALTGER